MEKIFGFVLFVGIIPMLLTIGQVFSLMSSSRRLMIVINLFVWFYEMIFLMGVCGVLPHMQVHFGAGVIEVLIVIFVLPIAVLGHIISLSIMSYKTTNPKLFLILLATTVPLLIILHIMAAEGNKDNNYYVKMGGLAGLYYDFEKVTQEREQRRQCEEAYHEASKPKKPKFETEFESLLYDAEHGRTWAQNSVGCRYANGDGVEINDTLAVKWFRMSAEGGDIVGELNLGLCYYNGKGNLAVDYQEAVKWFRKSAERGHGDAQYMLGRCYGSGKGVKQDDNEAYKWLRLAARQEHQEAQQLLEANGQRW